MTNAIKKEIKDMDEPFDVNKKRSGPWDKRGIDWLKASVWLVFIPIFSFFSWYGVYKLVMWMMYG